MDIFQMENFDSNQDGQHGMAGSSHVSSNFPGFAPEAVVGLTGKSSLGSSGLAAVTSDANHEEDDGGSNDYTIDSSSIHHLSNGIDWTLNAGNMMNPVLRRGTVPSGTYDSPLRQQPNLLDTFTLGGNEGAFDDRMGRSDTASPPLHSSNALAQSFGQMSTSSNAGRPLPIPRSSLQDSTSANSTHSPHHLFQHSVGSLLLSDSSLPKSVASRGGITSPMMASSPMSVDTWHTSPPPPNSAASVQHRQSLQFQQVQQHQQSHYIPSGHGGNGDYLAYSTSPSSSGINNSNTLGLGQQHLNQQQMLNAASSCPPNMYHFPGQQQQQQQFYQQQQQHINVRNTGVATPQSQQLSPMLPLRLLSPEERQAAESVYAIKSTDDRDVQADKLRKRRESHNAVERRRRDHLNDLISSLGNLVPGCVQDGLKINKSYILEETVEYVKRMQAVCREQEELLKQYQLAGQGQLMLPEHQQMLNRIHVASSLIDQQAQQHQFQQHTEQP